MTDESKVVFETDSDGRLLCPTCGARLYAAIEVWYRDVPVFADPDQAYGLDCWNYWDAKYTESNLGSLCCHHCHFEMPGDVFDEDMIQGESGGKQ